MAEDEPRVTEKRWNALLSPALIVLLVACCLVGAGLLPVGGKDSANWLWCMPLLALFVLLAGRGVTGRFAGFMIDSRNRMSLSQLQIALWTVVLVSAYLTAALLRIRDAGVAQPLDIALPAELWWALGISATSLAGTPLILNEKKKLVVPESESRETLREIARLEGRSDTTLELEGAVLRNTSPKEARFYQLVTGDETGNGGYLDLGKVQMLLFTLVVVVAYTVAIGNGFESIVSTGKFPELDASVVALLGVSHAGYLGAKLTPHSRTERHPPVRGSNPPPHRGPEQPL